MTPSWAAIRRRGTAVVLLCVEGVMDGAAEEEEEEDGVQDGEAAEAEAEAEAGQTTITRPHRPIQAKPTASAASVAAAAAAALVPPTQHTHNHKRGNPPGAQDSGQVS